MHAAADVAHHGTSGGLCPSRALAQPVSARATTTDAPVTHQAHVGRTQADREQREQCAHGEGEHRGPGGVPGVGELVGVDAELGLGVRAQGVVRGQLLGHLEGEVLGEALLHVEVGELGELLLGLLDELAALLGQQRLLGVALGADRDVLPGGHADRAGHEPGDTGDQDARWSVVAPATPTTRPAVDTMPSLAPSTAARSQLSRAARLSSWGSSSWGPICRSAASVLMGPIVRRTGTLRNEGEAGLGRVRHDGSGDTIRRRS